MAHYPRKRRDDIDLDRDEPLTRNPDGTTSIPTIEELNARLDRVKEAVRPPRRDDSDHSHRRVDQWQTKGTPVASKPHSR
jgi:hypothetical protein